MGFFKRVKFWANERLDLPDLVNLQDNIYEYLSKKNQKFLSHDKYIVTGFIPQSIGGLDIKVIVKDSVLMNTEGTVQNLVGAFWYGSGDDTIDSDLTATLTDNSTNYIEIQLNLEDSAPDTRAFWDATARNGQGDEYTQVVNTCTNIKPQLRINTIAFSGNPDYLPIARVVTSGGSISAIHDERPLFFRLMTDFAWSDGRSLPLSTDFSSADKQLTVMKEWMDAVMTTLKEIKGTATWYEVIGNGVSISDLLQDQNLVLDISGNIEYNHLTQVLSWDAPIKVLFPNNSFINYIDVGTLTSIANNECIYITLDRTGTSPLRTVQRALTGSVPFDADTYVIGIRDGDCFVLRNGLKLSKVHVYDEVIYTGNVSYPVNSTITLPLNSRNNNALKQYRTGRAELQVFINNVLLSRDLNVLTSTFQPTSYNSGTGFVSVPNTVDLSYIGPEDIFIDSLGNQFTIIGEVSNDTGAKGFKIATGQTVSLLTGAKVARQDYAEVGSDGSWQNTFVLRKSLEPNAEIRLRIQPIEYYGGSTNGGGGGGGADSLQSAYANGSTINISSGNPVTINGPTGEKLLVINGGLTVTGVIDPSGITFSRNASIPFSGLDGLWVDSLGNLNFYNKNTHLSSKINDQTTAISAYINNTASTLPQGRLVRLMPDNSIVLANWLSDTDSLVIGILLVNTATTAYGSVRKTGFIDTTIIAPNCFIEGAYPNPGSRIFLGSTDGKLTITPPIVNSGNFETVVGVWESTGLNLQIFSFGAA